MATKTQRIIGWFFPIIIGVLVWIALGLRPPAIFALALGQSPVTLRLQPIEK